MQLALKKVLPTYFPQSRKDNSELWGTELTIEAGQRVKIIAPSGSGKSSLMSFLYGTRNLFTGDILYGGRSVAGFTQEDWAQMRRGHISIVFQDLRLFPRQTVRENIEIKRQLEPFHNANKIVEMAERLGIGDKLETLAGTCSYGEQQRVAIIRALMQPFEILLLDEPFSHLDDANAARAMQLMLEEVEARKAAIVLADLERLDHYPFTHLYHL
ncbi:MAG: ATP-binding cassette domain-containing protein [Chitinophagaceae bacterium]